MLVTIKSPMDSIEEEQCTSSRQFQEIQSNDSFDLDEAEGLVDIDSQTVPRR